ncbi:MAG: glycosyltransferase involved in cell wall biosynthesis, partial [Planctomycetota bacterium]
MRIALVVHGFPPYERTGVENYTAGIARALAQRGHVVEVFAPRVDELSPEHAIRREEVDGYGVTWVTLNHTPDGPREMLDRPGVARSFGQFLDSERPDVVHLQHVVKLGVGPIFEASKRGIPMVYTAHDYYAACHRYTLLRPDLSHCDVRGDFMACGLCDAALGYLNEIEGLGDYQMGVLPDQLTEEQRAGLAGLLDDDPEAAGWEQGALDSATDLRRELDSLRLQAFSRLDLVLAPTKYLAAELVRGGISPERVEVLPYGVETQDLQGLTPVLSEGEGGQGELRFAFFGGFSKHKGVHLLLDAFGLLGPEAGASLSLWGYGSDAPYVAQLRARAKEVGAKWGGSYAREELPAILASADVVVVPSTWVENQPLVIREAFAARRPVLASDFGAIPESVHDEVDGLLFTVGDAEDLAAKMRRCLVEPGLVARLAAAIEPVHDAADQALELEPLYTRLVEAAAEEKVAADEKAMSSTVLASVQGFGARVQEVQALST